jgi:hypothetical protein
MTHSDVDAWISRLKAVPKSERKFDATADDASEMYGLADEVTGRLIASGLATQDSCGRWWFYSGDLHFLGLKLRTAQIFLETIGAWTKTLLRIEAQDSIKVWLQYRTLGRAHVSHDARRLTMPCEISYSTEHEPGTSTTTIAFELGSARGELSPEIEAIVEQLSVFDFYQIPDRLRTDLEFAYASQLLDCRAAQQMVAAFCSKIQTKWRTSFGLLIAEPLSSLHTWVDVYEGGEWVAVDPVLLGLLTEFGGLESDTWPRSPPLGAMLVRLADEPCELVRGLSAPKALTVLPTRIG